MGKITTIGLDIANNVFQVHGIDADGHVVLRKSLRRCQMQPFFETLDPCLIGMEACATAHHWARVLLQAGHDVRLIPPSYIKPYLRRQKNDAADAAAICEAVTRPSMRFVPVKSRDQQATLMLHSARELLISQRTALINALRAHFAELGIVVPQGARNVRQLIALLEDEQLSSPAVRVALMPLANALTEIETQVAKLDKAILTAHRNDDTSLRLATVPGIGPIIATCLSASVSDARLFEGGREFAAWLGLVPRQYSTGGKPRLGSISKMGNRHLRKLLVVGGHAALYRMRKAGRDTPLANWARDLLSKKPFKLVAVALANKIALLGRSWRGTRTSSKAPPPMAEPRP
jgi:transposase